MKTKKSSEFKKIKKLLEKDDPDYPKNSIVFKKYSFVRVLGWWCRIQHCNNKTNKGVVESAAFNWEQREIIINTDWCQSQQMYVETLRHEIFEMICNALKKRFFPQDERDNCIIMLEHKDIDIILHEYHAAVDSVR